MSYEVEIKYRITEAERFLQTLLEKGASFKNAFKQADTIYLPAGLSGFAEMEPGTPVLRSRDSNGKVSITLKRRSSPTSSKEIEFEVAADTGKVGDFYTELGYSELVKVVKSRSVYTLRIYEISIDSVQDLGDFVEIEVITENESEIAMIEKSIKAFGRELGLQDETIVNKQYDSMMLALPKT